MMIGSLLLFDCVLGLALVAVAMGMLLGRDLFRAIVLFILFGLLLTFAWCRLDAVDIALAEAGIGAGLTGALLLNTWAATGRETGSLSVPHASRRSLSSRVVSAVLLIVPLMLAAGAMAALVVPLAVATDTPRIAIDEVLPQSGVAHPVTAVLLNFRAYDTLLEVAVLLAAALAVLPLIASEKGSYPLKANAGEGLTPFRIGGTNKDIALTVGVVLEVFTKLMVPIAVLVAAYILWNGTKAPGGAFQSASLLCAIGVLLLVSGRRSPTSTQFHWRVLMVIGLGVFLLVGLAGAFEDKAFLEYPMTWAGSLIFVVEFFLTVSLTVILVSLFISTSPSVGGSRSLGKPVSTMVNSTKEAQS